VVPRSGDCIHPQTHLRVLEWLGTITAEVVESVPTFLEVSDQLVKDPPLLLFNAQQWKKLLHIILELHRDRTIFSVSTTCTLARTMVVCCNYKTADQQLYITLKHHLRGRDSNEEGQLMSLNFIFSS
jgi:hypothetical protein